MSFKSLLLAASLVLSCDADLQVASTGQVNRGQANGFNFTIEVSSLITNNNEVSIRWSDVEGALAFDVMVANDASCTKEVFRFRQQETSRTIEGLRDGLFYICVTAEGKDGSLTTPQNNGLALTIDRTRPVLKNPAVISVARNAGTSIDVSIDDMTELTYVWQQKSGEGQLSFSDPNARAPIITADRDGSYQIELTVTDAAGNADIIILPFVKDTAAPNVNAGTDQSISSTTATLAASVDESDAIIAWSLQSGPADSVFADSRAARTTANLPSVGTYVFLVTATDTAGNRSEDTVTVTRQPAPGQAQLSLTAATEFPLVGSSFF